MLVENVNFENKDDFIKGAGKVLNASGVCSYKRKFYIFKVAFDSNNNPEYSTYYKRLKDRFNRYLSVNAITGDHKFPEVNSKVNDEQYLILTMDGKAITGGIDGPWFFKDLGSVFDALQEAYTVIDKYTDMVLESGSKSLKDILGN